MDNLLGFRLHKFFITSIMIIVFCLGLLVGLTLSEAKDEMKIQELEKQLNDISYELDKYKVQLEIYKEEYGYFD